MKKYLLILLAFLTFANPCFAGFEVDGNLSVTGNATITGTISASNLTNVNNTSDANKPVSTATQTALDGKSATTHNHALNSLTEKSYNSLTDKPTIPTQYTDAMAQSANASALSLKADTTVLSGYVPTTRTVNSKVLSSNVTLTTADIADSTNKRYCTDAQKTVIGNTSGTNTGDKTLSELGGVPTTRTINAKALSSDITLTTADITDSADKRYVTDSEKDSYASGKFLVTYGDTTPSFLANKIISDGTINISINNSGAEEALILGSNSLPAGCVNSGQKDASGNANFMAKVDNNTISFTGFGFDAGTSYGGTNPVASAVDGQNVYILDGTNYKVYKSVNGGASFDAGTLYGGSSPRGIAVSGLNVYVIDDALEKVFKSTNGGAAWDAGTAVGYYMFGNFYPASYIIGIAISGNAIYIAARDGNKIYKSIDGGSTWSKGVSYGGTSPAGVAATGSAIYIVDTATDKVYKSTDGGLTWNTGTLYGGTYAAAIGANANGLYIVDDTASNKIYKSTDGSATWDAGTLYGGTTPTSICANATDIFITDSASDKVYKTLSSGSATSITFPDGSHATYDSIPNLTTLTSDGTWSILIEKGSTTAIATKSTIYEQMTEPTGWVDGDYWIDKSVRPYIPYKKANGAKSVVQFVRFGYAIRTSGTLATPACYPYNPIAYTPLPSTTITGIGQFATVTSSASGALVAPAGGTWLLLSSVQYNTSTSAVYRFAADRYYYDGHIVPGGTTVIAGRTGYTIFGAFIRIS